MNDIMKANRKFISNDDEAVSAVIGVILMVAITVAIAATVYVYVSGMIGGTQKQTPTLSCMVDATADKVIIVSSDVATNWTDITITNDSGVTCQWAIWHEGSNATTNTMPAGLVTAGDYIKIWGVSGNVKITFRYEPTNSLMGSWTVKV